MRQSDRSPTYRTALKSLWERGLLYPCSCTRRDVTEAASAPQEGAAPDIGPVTGPDGLIYPGTCRPPAGRAENAALPTRSALRLDMARAVAVIVAEPTTPLGFSESGNGPQGEQGWTPIGPKLLMEQIGDPVLARRDLGTSYHLSVVLDDAAQGVTLVTRGEDLFAATAIHVTLQRLLNLPTPRYHHHRLIRDAEGRRLAKRDDARALSKYRAEAASPADIRRLLGL